MKTILTVMVLGCLLTAPAYAKGGATNRHTHTHIVVSKSKHVKVLVKRPYTIKSWPKGAASIYMHRKGAGGPHERQ